MGFNVFEDVFKGVEDIFKDIWGCANVFEDVFSGFEDILRHFRRHLVVTHMSLKMSSRGLKTS